MGPDVEIGARDIGGDRHGAKPIITVGLEE